MLSKKSKNASQKIVNELYTHKLLGHCHVI